MAAIHRPGNAYWRGVVLLAVAAAVAGGCGLLDGGPERDPETGQLVEAEDIDVFDLEVGDCLDGFADGQEVSSIRAVPCGVEHTHEVFAALTLPDGEYPGREAVDEQAQAGCAEQFTSFVGRRWEDSELDYGYYTPTERSWENGDREVLCTIADPAGPVTGSLRNANR